MSQFKSSAIINNTFSFSDFFDKISLFELSFNECSEQLNNLHATNSKKKYLVILAIKFL